MTVSDRAEWQIAIGEAGTDAVFEPATGERAGVTFVCAHGAGGHMSDRGMLAVARTLREYGVDVVRFNFLYKQRKSGRPDPMPLLQQTVAAVVAHTRAVVTPARLVVGGRSMGGRAASMLAAEGFAFDGLLLLAYPLHPEGQPDKLRDAHLPAIRVPVLCLNGTRDGLCRPDLMGSVLQRVGPNWQMHWLEGADHSFHVLKSSGRTDADVLTEVGHTVQNWLSCSVR